jgi:hypothetical protein
VYPHPSGDGWVEGSGFPKGKPKARSSLQSKEFKKRELPAKEKPTVEFPQETPKHKIERKRNFMKT